MAKVVCVLYPDPVDGYPKAYARDDIPKIERYPDGTTTPFQKSKKLTNKVEVRLVCHGPVTLWPR